MAALTAGVTLAHLWLAGEWLPARLGDGADAQPRRIEVTFVRELAPAPPPVALAPVPRRQPVAPPPAPAASAPPATVLAEAKPAPVVTPALEWPAEQESEWPTELPAETTREAATETPAEIPAETPAQLAAGTPPPAPPAAASAPEAAQAPAQAAFDWPPSTRLSYRLTGNYRGPVEGQAQVEWLRAGTRYQVHMEVSIGPFFAPLMSRRVASAGEITPEGLRPSRYDEETRIVTRDPRRLVIFLDADRVRLPGGAEPPRPAGVQDSASQFVQLTWLFTTQPALLQPGVTITLPLALPRRVQDWVYEVQEPEWLYTPAGAVTALHVKPRRESMRPGDLSAEMWVAPSLQNLPVRIVIRQDEETYVDLLIERLPLQAEPGR